MRLLVTGASGVGTSTLGMLVATRLSIEFQEADDIHWLATTPPFQHQRPYEERRELMARIISDSGAIVVAGSVISWGKEIENAFDAIIFLTAPTRIRLERIRQRDIQRFGDVDPEFLEWAAQYDSGSMPGRSRARHNAWLSGRSCPVLSLESTQEPEILTQEVCGWLHGI